MLKEIILTSMMLVGQQVAPRVQLEHTHVAPNKFIYRPPASRSTRHFNYRL